MKSIKSMENRTVTRNIRRSIKLIYCYDRKYFVLCVVQLVMNSLQPTIELLLMQAIINGIQKKVVSFEVIVLFLLVSCFIKIIASLINTVVAKCGSKFKYMFDMDLEMRLYSIISSMDTEDFELPETYDLLKRTESQRVDSILLFYTQSITAIQSLITGISLLIIVSRYNVLFLLVFVISPIIQYFFILNIGKKQYQLIMERTPIERKIWYIDYLMTSGIAHKELKLFAYGKSIINEYCKMQESIINQDYVYVKKNLYAHLFFTVIDIMLRFIVYLYIGFQAFCSKILLGSMTTYIASLDKLSNEVYSFVDSLNVMVENSLYVNNLFEFIDRYSDNVEKKTSDELIKITEINRIEFKNVSYKYTTSNNYALKDINFTIKQSDVIGIAGRNGSGKSTLLKLIMGLYNNYEGEIIVNSIDLRHIDKTSYFKCVSAVFQDYMKYEWSILDNVRISDVERNASTDNNVEELLKKVQFPNRLLNQGINTIIGNWFGQENLSSGEWQKIAIARCLFADASMILLDEPDASLDTVTEKELLNLIKDVMKEKVGVYTSHNSEHLCSVCSKILVLDAGRQIAFDTPNNVESAFRDLESD